MKIAVASGKGGTGKTLVSVNLAAVAKRPVGLLDCDVEVPNAYLFLKGSLCHSETVTTLVPTIDSKLCTGCGACARFCQFHALVTFGLQPSVFEDLCHGCGGCTRICPNNAISEIERPIGVIETSDAGSITLVSGRMNVGVAMATPIVRAVKERAQGISILDAPPGTACPMVETVRDADFVLLVTEPTPFGLSDLQMAVDVVRTLNRTFGVVVNRAEPKNTSIRDYCVAENIDILTEIPLDRNIAETYARGEIVANALPNYRETFETLWQNILVNGDTP